METAAEPVASPPPAAPPPAPSRRWPLGLVLWLVVVAALAAGGWYGWRWLQRAQAERAAEEAQFSELMAASQRLRAQVEQLAHEQEDDAGVTRRNAAELAALNTRVEENTAALARMSETLQGGRLRVQLAAVEQVLLMANDRALLARDAVGAAEALAQADARLASLNEPRLFTVREAIAQERSALAGLPKLDLTAAALSLSNLVQRLPQLPLQGRLPGRLAQAEELSTPPPDLAWPTRLWLSLKQALRAVFIVRRDEGTTRLLPTEQQALVVHIGLLKLEGARLALMRGNTAAFREMCAAAATWLRDYFESQDPGVVAALAELERLRALDLSPPMPDISRSLELLRGQMSAP